MNAIDELIAQRDKVLAIHRRDDIFCHTCGIRWPCETARAYGVNDHACPTVLYLDDTNLYLDDTNVHHHCTLPHNHITKVHRWAYSICDCEQPLDSGHATEHPTALSPVHSAASPDDATSTVAQCAADTLSGTLHETSPSRVGRSETFPVSQGAELLGEYAALLLVDIGYTPEHTTSVDTLLEVLAVPLLALYRVRLSVAELDNAKLDVDEIRNRTLFDTLRLVRQTILDTLQAHEWLASGPASDGMVCTDAE